MQFMVPHCQRGGSDHTKHDVSLSLAQCAFVQSCAQCCARLQNGALLPPPCIVHDVHAGVIIIDVGLG